MSITCLRCRQEILMLYSMVPDVNNFCHPLPSTKENCLMYMVSVALLHVHYFHWCNCSELSTIISNQLNKLQKIIFNMHNMYNTRISGLKLQFYYDNSQSQDTTRIFECNHPMLISLIISKHIKQNVILSA
jgi:hypothetical protein